MDIAPVMRRFNLSGEAVLLQNNVWEIGGEYILKRYEDYNRLSRNLDCILFLAGEGLPVQVPVRLDDGKLFFEEAGARYVLLKKLFGEVVREPYACENRLFENAGEALALLHRALQKYNGASLREGNLLGEADGWMAAALEKSGWPFFTPEIYEGIVARLREINDALPRQPIHRDVHFGNLLFSDCAFSGYLDFDLSHRNVRVFDLAYFCAGLLVGKENSPEAEHWFLMVEHIARGYERATKLTEAEKRGFGCVMMCIELLFCAYFLDVGERERAENAWFTCRFLLENQNRLHLA